MRMGSDNFYRLTYCTNIHPTNGWEQVLQTLKQVAPALRERIAPDQPFGIGLRLSGIESKELLQGDNLQRFKSFLDDHNLYVFTMNGFPYGPFHQQPVKADVHTPDWRTDERVNYTLRLIDILAAVLPEGEEGSISTSPLSYKAWIDSTDENAWKLLTCNLLRVAERLVEIHRQQGKFIHVDLEPEPDGLLENSAELADYFDQWLLTFGAEMFADMVSVPVEQARQLLLEHIRVCFDTCHVAVAYENPAEVLERYKASGIKVGKIQISSALRVPLPTNLQTRQQIQDTLKRFAESTYLHQVIQRNRDGSLVHYPDLPDALPYIGVPEAAEWRVHFHVPIFVEDYTTFHSTSDDIRRTFALLHEQPFCPHLEIETYTWDVLPSELKRPLIDSIEREYRWVLDVFHAEHA